MRNPGTIGLLVLCLILSGRVAVADTSGAGDQVATYEELAPLTPTGGRIDGLSALCLAADGNLLIGDTGNRTICVCSPEGKTIATWKPGFAPQALCARPDGTVFAAGEGTLAKLDPSGKVVKTVDLGKNRRFAGLAATDAHVFLVVSGESGYGIQRFDLDLANGRQIADGLRGCCGHLDIATHGGAVYVAENAHHRIVKYDAEGKVLDKWGEQDREKIDKFGSCCNPMNLCISPAGDVFTAESGPDRVKCFSLDGKFRGLVRDFATGKSCTSVALAVRPDGSRVYVADSANGVVRVLARKPADDQAKSDAPPSKSAKKQDQP